MSRIYSTSNYVIGHLLKTNLLVQWHRLSFLKESIVAWEILISKIAENAIKLTGSICYSHYNSGIIWSNIQAVSFDSWIKCAHQAHSYMDYILMKFWSKDRNSKIIFVPIVNMATTVIRLQPAYEASTTKTPGPRAANLIKKLVINF